MQKIIAVFVGIIFAIGYAMLTYDKGDSIELKLIIGSVFGFAIASSMIAKPKTVTKRQIKYFMIPILTILSILIAFTKPEKTLVVAIWASLLIAGHYSFVYIGSKGSVGLNGTIEE